MTETEGIEPQGKGNQQNSYSEDQKERKIDICDTIHETFNKNEGNNFEEANNENEVVNEYYQDDGNCINDENFDDNEEDANFDNEVVIDTDEDVDLGYEDDAPINEYTSLQSVVNTYNAFMYESPAYLSPSGIISVSLPTNFLPLSLQAAYGFNVSPNILNIELELDDKDWSKNPIRIDIQHPTLHTHFVGRALIMDAVDNFFSENYKPRLFYRSESYLLYPTGRADENKKNILISESFDSKSVERALIICSNNINQARDFLCTGLMPPHDSILSIEYSSCPLLFLILEFADCFLNLQDHCCICGRKMEPGLKPCVCTKELCNFRFNEIGLGSNVVAEIQRDPLACDLMVSLFSSAINTEFLTPAPDFGQQNPYQSLISKFQSMNHMKGFSTDSQLAQAISGPAFELLRWILLSNRSQLISLPKQFKLPQFENTFQFMTLISTPEAEKTFKELKNDYGSMFLWHGSNGVRWHSIIRNGLKNCSGTKLQANGAALGSGIYLARSSSTSWGYSQPAKNNYNKSVLGKNLHIIGLCEVAKMLGKNKKDGPLKDHGWAHTLTNEDACVVRFLFVEQSCNNNMPFNVDVDQNPPKKVPTLRDMLNWMAGLHD